MPLGLIQEIPSTERLKNVWLLDLVWPTDMTIIKRLTPMDFYSWLYGLNPRDAILISADKEFQAVIQRKKNPIYRAIDALWRMRHGYC